MRIIALSLLTFFSLLSLGALHAQERTGTPTGVVVPSGFEAFFESLHELMQKYPAADRRFAITDRDIEGRAGFENKNPTFTRSLCPSGQACSRICDEGHLFCCGTCSDILR
jgi:hypothetical protein